MASLRVAGVGLDDLFRDELGQVWRVVGIADRPTVSLERMNVVPFSPRFRQHIVIGSPLFNELQQLVPITDQQEV